MLVIGILGGVASGKSYVARLLAEHGAAVLDADRAGHETLKETDVKTALRERWGDKIFDAGGEIRRAEVASIVFGDSPQAAAELRFLEQITHPRIGERLQAEIRRLTETRPQPVAVVLDAPVMVKAGWHRFCDKILFVDAPREVRLARALQRGWSEQQFADREAAQESIEDKLSLADVVIENGGQPAETQRQIEQFWRDHMIH